MKNTKLKAPKKKIRNQRGIYSQTPKKSKKAYSKSNGHIKIEEGVLHEEEVIYRTDFSGILDIGTSPNSGIEAAIVDEKPPEMSEELIRIEKLNSKAEALWADKLLVDKSLTRALVSFQANKGRAVYRWFKYKEGFSAGLIEHLLNKYRITKGTLFDPFAGSGTALFAAGGHGMRAEGIELLPIGQTIIATKQIIDFCHHNGRISKVYRSSVC